MTNQLPSSFYLDKTRSWLEDLVYCRTEYKDALTCALAVSHNKNAFSAVPYILATSEDPSSGKSTIAFDIPLLLAHNIEEIDRTTTRDAMNNMFISRETPNTAWDDVGKIFGQNGTNGSTSNFYTQLVRSYKRNGNTKMSRNGAMMKVSTYGMAFLNGLMNAVPKDLFTRCIHFKMRAAPDGVVLRDVLSDSVEAEAKVLKEALHAWAGSQTELFKLFMKGSVNSIHAKLTSRRRQLWGPLFAVAYAAGGDWPRRIFDAFILIALDASEKPQLVPQQMVLMDAAAIIMQRDLSKVFTTDLVELLREVPDGQLYRDSEDDSLTDRLIPDALGPPKRIHGTMLYGPYKGKDGMAKGYSAVPILKAAADLRDMLYPPMEPVTSPAEDDLAFTPDEEETEDATA